MKTLVTLIVMAGGRLCMGTDDPQRMALPQSGEITVAAQAAEGGKNYDVRLRPAGGGATVSLLSRRVAAQDDRIVEWRRLISCDEDPRVIAVLMEATESTLVLVQYERSSKTATEVYVAIPDSMSRELYAGGNLKVAAPDRIVLTKNDNQTQAFTVSDGKLIDENGKIYGQPVVSKLDLSVLNLASPGSAGSFRHSNSGSPGTNKSPASSGGPVAPGTADVASSPSQGIWWGVGIVAAASLLLAFKRRSNS